MKALRDVQDFDQYASHFSVMIGRFCLPQMWYNITLQFLYVAIILRS